MQLIVKKFIDYLKADIEVLRQEVITRSLIRNFNEPELLHEDEFIIKKISDRQHIIRIISVPKEEWEMHGEIFIDFDILKEMFKNSPLNTKEEMFIVFYLLEKNIATHILETEIRFFDRIALEKHHFKYLTKDEARKIIESDSYRKLFVKEENGELTEHESKILEDIRLFTFENPLQRPDLVGYHEKINTHYFLKLNSFDFNDIKEIVDTLRNFNLDEELCLKIKALLEKEVRKRKTENNWIFTDDSPKKKISKISDKEYLILKKELSKYYDLDNEKIVQPLNLELQIFCVNLLIRMGIPKEKIREILRIINKQNIIIYDEPSVLFEQYCRKCQYYSEVLELDEELQMLKDVLDELLTSKGEDLRFWQQEFKSGVENILKLIPKTYDYEISMGEELANMIVNK